MSIVIKYPTQSKENNELLFEKLNSLNSLDWAYFGGWIDSDAYFTSRSKAIGLGLIDRDVVEHFSKTFEVSLLAEQLRAKYYKKGSIPKICYRLSIAGPKVVYIANKAGPYVIGKSEQLKNFLILHNNHSIFTLMKHTDAEFLHWLCAFFEGDGSIGLVNNNWAITFYSNNKILLQYIKDKLINMNLIQFNKIHHTRKKGKRKFNKGDSYMVDGADGYSITKAGKELVPFLECILPIMKMKRKKIKVIDALVKLTYGNRHIQKNLDKQLELKKINESII